MTTDTNSIFIGAGTSCAHSPYRPFIESSRPYPRAGELRRCPKCNKWWRQDVSYKLLWQPIRWYHFKERQAIREHERKESMQNHQGMTLISNRPYPKNVED